MTIPTPLAPARVFDQLCHLQSRYAMDRAYCAAEAIDDVYREGCKSEIVEYANRIIALRTEQLSAQEASQWTGAVQG